MDLETFLADRAAGRAGPAGVWRRVLVVDDSVSSGATMLGARRRIEAAGLRDAVFCAVYGAAPQHAGVDVVFETVPEPRFFQWNWMRRPVLRQCCLDIDGVLCRDPSEEQNDDGERYLAFLAAAEPFLVPRAPVRFLVTSRLEKYRRETERWLEAMNIGFDALIMLDLPSKEARQKAAAHGRFKAEFYRDCDARLFIESNPRQAAEIARIAGKPVFCVDNQRMIRPEP
jgi:uncharacterized HAD superfamily protein